MLGVVHPTSYEYHNIHEEQQQQQQQQLQQQHQHEHEHQHHDTHSNEQIIYGQPHHGAVSQHNELLTTENFPSEKHTQVIFKSSTESYQSDEHYGHDDHQQQQYLPPSQVNTYRAPLVYHKYEHYYNDQAEDGGQYDTGQLNSVSFFPDVLLSK